MKRLRPLSSPQSAAHQVRLLLEEAGLQAPSPAQIGVWVKLAGGLYLAYLAYDHFRQRHGSAGHGDAGYRPRCAKFAPHV